MLQGHDVGDSRMNVRPVQGAQADDAEAMDCQCLVNRYANTSRRQVEHPAIKTPEIHRRGIVCAKLSAGLTLIRESSIAPGQHIWYYFLLFTHENDPILLVPII